MIVEVSIYGIKKWQQINEKTPITARMIKQVWSETNSIQKVVKIAPKSMFANAIPFSMAKYLPWISSQWFFLQRAFIQAPQQTQSNAAPYPPKIDPRIETVIPRPPVNWGIYEIQLVVQHAAATFICVVKLILSEGAKELEIIKDRKLTSRRTGPIYLSPYSLCSYMQVTMKLKDPQVVARVRKNMANTIVSLSAFILTTINSLSNLFSDSPPVT